MTTSTTTLQREGFDARIAQLAARQGNAFSRAQVHELGATDPMIQRRLHTGRWERPFPGVYSIAGMPPSWLSSVWKAYLAVGPSAVVSHETALQIHGVQVLPRTPSTLTVPHGGHVRLKGLIVHQIDDLRPNRVMTMAGLPVSSPERTVVDLAAWLSARRLGDVIDDLVSAKRCSCSAVAACLAEVARPRKPGVRKLADGRRWHTRIRDLEKDHLRDTEAARVGWLTLRFVHEQIVHEPHEVCAAIADVLAVRSRSWVATR